MITLGNNFIASVREFKKLRTIVLAAMFIALNLALDMVTIYITPDLRLGVGFVCSAMVGMLFGPAVAVVTAAAGDIIAYLMKPMGAYFPGFTISAVLGGVIYGLLFYRQEIKLWRCFLAKLLVSVLINIGLNTLWLSIMGGKGFIALLPARVLKNAVLWPIESLILYFVALAVKKAWGAIYGAKR